jgi:hypothetical protein
MGRRVIERRNSGFIVSLDGRPPGWKAEYRSVQRAVAPPPWRRSATDYQQAFDGLIALCDETDRKLAEITFPSRKPGK